MPLVSRAAISLPDRYRVVGHIADGGMASVWEAHDQLLDRPVAVKFLAPHLSEDETARLRFQREARAAARLSAHPHVVTIYDVGDHDGHTFIVMELMRGGSIAEVLRRKQAVPRHRAVRWLRQAASALDTAHAAGVVHRDIKPANLLLDEHDRLAVADYGIALLAWEDHATLTGQVLGTAAYLSPEQARGEPAVAASDRYALAAVAFELLTGQKPFPAEHFAAQARAHLDDEPPRASERAADLGPAVDAVIAKGMAKDPDARWSTARELVDRLEEAVAAGTVTSDDNTATDVTVVAAPVATPPPACVERDLLAVTPRRGTGAGSRRGLWVLVSVAAVVVGALAFAVLRSGKTTSGTPAGVTTTTPDSKAAPSTTIRTSSSSTTARTAREPAQNDATQLQLRAYSLNNAGNFTDALPYAQKAVGLCKGSQAVSPCAYALFELARAQRMTGDPRAAIATLEERQVRFPNDQKAAVDAELAAARGAAGG